MPDIGRRKAIQLGLTHLLMPTGAIGGYAVADNETRIDRKNRKRPRSNHLAYTAGGAGAGFMVGRAVRASMHISDAKKSS